MAIKSWLTNLGLVEGDAPQPPAQAVPAQTTSIHVSAPSYLPPITSSVSDPAIVAKIKTAVFGASPIISQFMQNVDLVRPQFPNDDIACMKAAIAFTRVSKDTLLGELNRSIAAALLHTKSSLDADHKKARDTAVGDLETLLTSINSDIAAKQAQIAELQRALVEKQSRLDEVQGKIKDVEKNLTQQDSLVRGSFTQVEQYVATLEQTLSKL